MMTFRKYTIFQFLMRVLWKPATAICGSEMDTGVDKGDMMTPETVEVVDHLTILDVQNGQTMATIQGFKVTDGRVICL